MKEKTYITAQALLEDAFRLGMKILKSGFRPDFIIGVWRGGTPVGIAIQELMEWFGIPTDHIAIRTSAYTGIDERSKTIRVHGLNYIVHTIEQDQSLLIVDDVYETGLSIKAVLDTLRSRAGQNTPQRIRIATVYYKPAKNLTERIPDFYLHETDQWLVFPHELKGLTREELGKNKPWILDLIDDPPNLPP